MQQKRTQLVVFPMIGTLILLCLLLSPQEASGSPQETGIDPKPDRDGQPREVRYDRDIRPLFSERCFTCHGPDPAKRKAGLRLDEEKSAHAVKDGIAALVPGDPSESELWCRLTAEDPIDRMPPSGSDKRPFSTEELNLVRRWIEQGARYEKHWSFVPPERSAVPEPNNSDWCQGEIDRFVLAELESRGIEPSPQADRETWLRRVFLDLTGLPPTPEEIQEFLSDKRSDAVERWVERLLHEEPYVTRYAENMAVPWLDAARYADTSGLHMDAGRQMWAWRDWLLSALRNGMPFDEFLSKQLAGDLLPDATLADRIASGFNRNHVTTDEGGAISEEYLVEYAVDRASTTGSVFLGLTVGCARCHEHKYDPISQEEFYSFYSFFNSIDEPGLYSQVPDDQRALEPFILVPTPEREAALSVLQAELDSAQEELDTPIEGEDEARQEFLAKVVEDSDLTWVDANVVWMKARGGANLELLPDSSILASGENPARDTHVIHLVTQEDHLRMFCLESLPDPSLPQGRVGRAPNGNAVLQSIRVEATSLRDSEQRQEINLSWAWADIEQANGDFRVVNALEDNSLGWAVDGHGNVKGSRTALFLADKPFGFEGGTRLEVHLNYDSVFSQHAFGRVRLSVARLESQGVDRLWAAMSGWYSTATFRPAQGADVFEAEFGPEEMVELDLTREFGDDKYRFNYIPTFLDERLNVEFAAGVGATYVARRIFSPGPREFDVFVGSDDGFRLFLDGEEVAKKKVDRGVAPDQDRVTLKVGPGEHTVVFKIVNTGGPAGYYWRTVRRQHELNGSLLAAFLPEHARTDVLESRLIEGWRHEYSPSYRERREEVAALEKRVEEAQSGIPRTMVMKELAAPRETFVLVRGEYDKPDMKRKVSRAVPAAFGRLPSNAPEDRRGLAQWMVSPENPLVARVAVNRLWQICFGTGIVATSEDFGMQGEWPSHPELLDWLAVTYLESGWDTKAMLARIVTSKTYRQSSRVRPELHSGDPANRLLARYPRRRLSAEQIRDQALYVAGILEERLGGPSVKPYQPEGLWKEVAMLQSNTRFFERGMGEDLWRRSLYTYWKRASPPPSLMTFDAPTREFCTIKRVETATPLQALVLWNDEQFVEAARLLARRTLTERPGALTEQARLARMFQRCTGRLPDEGELDALVGALSDFRTRYEASPEDAEKLLGVGEYPALGGDDPVKRSELAAWTMIASTFFSLDAMISRG